MDTSSSTVNQSTVSSNRVWYLAKGLTVSSGDITPEEWLVLIRFVLQTLKPKIDYLSGFTEFGNHVEAGSKSFAPSCSDKELCTLMYSSEEIPAGPKLEDLANEALYLTRSTRFLLCRTIQFNRAPLIKPHRVLEIPDHHQIRWATDEDILRLLNQLQTQGNFVPGYEILTSIANVVKSTLDAMVKRREAIQGLENEVLAVLRRISA